MGGKAGTFTLRGMLAGGGGSHSVQKTFWCQWYLLMGVLRRAVPT